MKATLIYQSNRTYDDGAIMEIRVWKVPQAVPGSAHELKYRLFYGYPGRRLIGYDNERGKGDHKHLEERETLYAFESLDKLIDDFLAEVTERRK
ncbi:MAG: DUF6516 family protein [Sulfuricellaceae bacterium]